MPKRIEHRYDDNGTELKRCSDCEEWLSLVNFGPHKRTSDKLQSRCKPCHSKHSCQYAKNNSARIRVSRANRRANNPEVRHKDRVRNLTNNAILRGELVRPDNCELCGYPSDRIQAHHISYDPKDYLNVTFLCVACHVSVHQQLKIENPMFNDDDIDLGQEENTGLIADNVVELHCA